LCHTRFNHYLITASHGSFNGFACSCVALIRAENK